jgi:heat-inducible transcriptional repressor
MEQMERQQLEEQLTPDDPHRMVTNASQILSDLTHFAGSWWRPAVAAPPFGTSSSSASRSAACCWCWSHPTARCRTACSSPTAPTLPRSSRKPRTTSTRITRGLEFDQLRTRVKGELIDLHRDISGLMQAAIETGSDALRQASDGVVISGGRNLLEVDEISGDMHKLRRLFDLFERKTQLLDILEISEQAEGVKIFIGGESQLVALDECSIVTAPYEVDGQVVGTVGVIGPTRMAYERVIPIVDVTAKLLSSALSQH